MPKQKQPPRLQDRLVLHRFICDEFGEQYGMDGMLHKLNTVVADTDGDASKYCEALLPLHAHAKLSSGQVAEYDANIAKHSRELHIGEEYGRQWKPYQYLALLFTEHYLARYFDDLEGLCASLNRIRHSVYRHAPEYRPDDLHTLAFQSATGSGKTLLMHAHILQFQRYQERAGRPLNNIILLTPNEQMSLQHLHELKHSGLEARLFSADARPGLFRHIEIIDLNKLAEKKGIKRVASSAFGDDNLVLVDEGHLGASGRVWRKRRKELARGGFTFEYSATFNQVAGKDKEMLAFYGKCLLFDYAYRHFHQDGYGKDYSISNLQEDMGEHNSNIYLLGCLLIFYQQYRIWQDKGAQWQDFNITRPLWVFLGRTVIGSSNAAKETTSDVVRILDFLGWVLAHADNVQPVIDALLQGKTGLHDEAGKDYFSGRFDYLKQCKTTNIYDDICMALFHGRGHLHVAYLARGEGEMHLRCGDNPTFGVVNVGDSTKLHKLLTELGNPDLKIEREAGFAKRLFADVDRPDSTVNIVIGARRFIAGWNSWRVSTMGLMHVGVGEGPEIIQMFGRGVRLRGWKMSLKRHQKSGAELPSDGTDLVKLETLNIFGLRANYMQTFKTLMEEAGIDTELKIFTLPVAWNFGRQKGLKLIRVKGGEKFECSAERPVLCGPAKDAEPVVLNLYSSLQKVDSGSVGDVPEADEVKMNLEPWQTGFFDKARIYEKLLEHKRRNNWHNLTIERQAIDRFLEQTGWYELYMPPNRRNVINDLSALRELEDLAIDLITRYAERLWRTRRSKWEKEHLEVVKLDKNHPNIVKEYKLLVSAAQEKLIRDVKRLEENLRRTGRSISPYATGVSPYATGVGVGAIMTDIHAYKPLLSALKDCQITVQPVALNPDEKKAVDSLVELAGEENSCLQGWELYLLRNMSRGRGVSFFDDFHYYPDFIIWLKKGTQQHVVFLDPKGLSRYGDKEKRKVQLHHNIKGIEQKIREKDSSIHLHAYILSVTARGNIGEQRPLEQWKRDGVYFLDEQNYMQDIIEATLAS